MESTSGRGGKQWRESGEEGIRECVQEGEIEKDGEEKKRDKDRCVRK